MNQPTNARHEGRVSQYWPERRYGYLTFLGGARVGTTIFYHQQDCLGFPAAGKGDRVTFLLGERNGREKAVEVVVTDSKEAL